MASLSKSIEIVAPDSEVPTKANSVSFVELPEFKVPVDGVASSVTEVMTGSFGAVLSTVTSNVSAVETLPAASVAVTEIV